MKKFKKFYIETTSICNLACSFCPPTHRQAQFIKVEDFRKILDDIKPHTDYIYFHVKGEPLLHPKIDQLLDISHEKGFKVNITTNGTLLPKVRHKLLGKPALRQMNFSLHSFDGHEGSTDREGYLRNVLSFVREAVAASDLIVSFRLWNLTQDNETNLQRMRNRETLAIIEEEFNLDYRIEEKVTPGSGVKLAERIYLNQDYEFDWPDLRAPEDDGKGFCHALRNQAGILVDGTVIPCCLDGEGIINLGNVYKTPFSEIVEGERANRLYEGFSRREAVEELCRKCGYRKRFGGGA
ncbi:MULTISPECIES: radical SAM/SPASM domain-containing protein [Paenibacillus]|jgi:radical SAM protein with 4Fe4S-binding SPASM domain|uniref:Radical SAM additional 4Fe4S-binding SPASM domain-containing protein n=2 Tax=Paenibacillus barengoltzii TaxID=343517 RepID=R9LE69_9BACL|nr:MULTISPECIES: radical SAM/SPASM domain-containing protein [Paenibacillus]EOS56828.1 radical SAM additional 4Fe4S-binding SPASM domain-containing protein [Paenibacillus barengoltzii G22]MDU0329528.1 radical SAM/SPASM domain-containing protein [Paenibacillus sp. 3LSP]MEC2344802.1 radical SAM/SPASM domain-containing protein [Paenibacillus barengoltzii]SMF27817.1 radical SAM additional 4Fe4S-binding SPASM domain-containing protein [Paenibacillus barengoltzii J12]